MKAREAVSLIEDAVRGAGKVWGDIGAGEGVFTRALIEILGPTCLVFAVDRDGDALAALADTIHARSGRVIPVEADFTEPFALPELKDVLLDGMLIANALHFVRDVEHVLARLTMLVRPGGRVVIIEYDRRDANPWVPYPLPMSRLPAIATRAGLTTPRITTTRPSRYQGILYVAASDRLHVPS